MISYTDLAAVLGTIFVVCFEKSSLISLQKFWWVVGNLTRDNKMAATEEGLP